jgi:DnaK suppressor protein
MQPQDLRQALGERLELLLQRENAIAHHLRGNDGRNEVDFSERATIIEMDEVLEGLDDAARLEFAQIRAALDRLDTPDWKNCVACGAEIPDKRLQIMPHASRCSACAS